MTPIMEETLKYDARIDLSNKNNSHTQLIQLTGHNKKVLEVGPAAGYVSEVLQKHGCTVTGIELDPDAARLAARFCRRIIVGNVEEIDFEETFAGERFDIAMFGDVLEHLVDPQRVLERVRAILNPGGSVIASVPNIAHASIRLALIRGEFRYTPLGLLDKTHLRFYTRETLGELFRDAGYTIRVWRRVQLGAFGTEQGLRTEDYPPYLTRSISEDPESLTYQFVVKAHVRDKPLPVNGHSTRQRVESRAGANPSLASLWSVEERTQELERGVAVREKRLRRQQQRLAEQERRITELEQHAGNLRHQINLITGSLGYRLLERVRGVIRFFAPPGSPQRIPLIAVRRSMRLVRRRGPRVLLGKIVQVWEWPGIISRLSRAQSLNVDPNEQYQLWLRTHALTPDRIEAIQRKSAQLSHRPKVSIIMPVYNTEPSWLRAAIESVCGQLYDNWELCIADDGSEKESTRALLRDYQQRDKRIKVKYLKVNSGISAASNEALAMASGEFFGLLDHDDELKADALYEVVKLLNKDPDLDFIYSDEDKKDMNGRLVEPFFKPDWSPDLLMSVNYVTHLSVFRKEIVDRVGGFRQAYDGSQDYDLVLRVSELTDKVAHIAQPLYSWRKVPGSTSGEADAKQFAVRAAKAALRDALTRRGYTGEVLDGLVRTRYRVRYDIVGDPKVAIIIPTRDRLDMLSRCVESIRRKSSYRNFEIIVVDNDSREQRTLDYLSSFDGRVVRYPHEFNFAKIINMGAREAEGADALLFLNNDTEVISAEWIEAMLEHAQRPEVAAVGARLLYPDGRIQHEGVIIGLAGGSAGNVDHGGYFGMGDTIRNCSSVTAACMMTRPQAFWDIGGFEERLRVAFNDVDFCLRARAKDYLIVYTPYALLYHYESASRGKLHPMEDEQFFRDRWGNPGEYRDPYYNPNLDIRRPFAMHV